MKKIFTIVLALFVMTGSLFADARSANQAMSFAEAFSETGTIYGGLTYTTYEVSNIKDLYFEDDRGTIVDLPFKSRLGESIKAFAPGFYVGADCSPMDMVKLLAEVDLYFAKKTILVEASAGALYCPINTGSLHVGFGGYVGIAIASIELGTWNGEPLRINGATIKKGDTARLMLPALTITPVADLTYRVNDDIAVFAQAGYAIGINLSQSQDLYFGDATIPSSESARFDTSLGGVRAKIGVTYKMSALTK